MSVQDLRQSSQDVSAFYLGQIYEVLADPNVTRADIPSLAKPPPFTPKMSAILVNAMFLLSFVLSLISALFATLLQQWARRFTRVTQPVRCGPEKRARMRAFFSHGADKLDARAIAQRLPLMLHLSLFIFLVGLGISLYSTNYTVFNTVAWSLVLFSAAYAVITIMPIFLPDSPYFTPLSNRLFRLTHLSLALITVPFAIFVPNHMVSPKTKERFLRWFNRRLRWASGGVEKQAEEVVFKRSWEYDIRILRWSIGALGDDDALEHFFEAIPGFFSSKLVKHLRGNFPEHLLNRFWNALNGFLCRTLSSNLVAESVKSRRIHIGMTALDVISRSRASSASSIPCDIHVGGWEWDQMPHISEMEYGQLLKHCSSDHEHTAHYVQSIVAKILATAPDRDDCWIKLATGAFGISEQDLRSYIDHGHNSVALAISSHLIRQSIRCRFYDWDALKAFPVLDIRDALPKLQHDFCLLWNEVVQEARIPRNHKPYSPPVRILRWTYRHHAALHRDTDAGSTTFVPSTNPFDSSLLIPSAYPLCTIPPHLTAFVSGTYPDTLLSQPGGSSLADGLSRQPTPAGSAVSQQVEGNDVAVAGSPSKYDPTTTGATAQAFSSIPTIFRSNSSSRVTLAYPPASGIHHVGLEQSQTMEEFRHRIQSPRARIVPSMFGILMNSLKHDGSTDGTE